MANLTGEAQESTNFYVKCSRLLAVCRNNQQHSENRPIPVEFAILEKKPFQKAEFRSNFCRYSNMSLPAPKVGSPTGSVFEQLKSIRCGASSVATGGLDMVVENRRRQTCENRLCSSDKPL